MATSRLAKRRREIKRRFLNAARADLGYRESGDNLTKYGRWYPMNGAPWCAMAVSYWAARAKLTKIIPKHAYTPAGADWFKARGQWGVKPRVGALAYYDVSGMGRISHVGIVEKVLSDGSWYSLEGNTNAHGSREGKVVRRQHRTRVGPRGGFAYPAYTEQARRELAA